MSRVVFLTDQHLCAATRWDETLRVMDWCVSECAALKPAVIAFGGDLFHRRPDVTELRTAAEWLVRLAEIAPVVGVAGNHDPQGLNVLNMLESKYPVHFADRPEIYVAGGIEFALLPWPMKAHLLSTLGDAGKEHARQVGVELLLNVLRGLARPSDLRRCFVGHVQLRGAKVSTGQPLAPGADFEIGTEDLTLARCEAYLLGHIHLPDDTQVDGAPISYGGSFRRTAYGEVEEKSLVVLDFHGAGPSRTVTRSRIEIPCAAMHLATDEWDVQHQSFAHGWDGLPDLDASDAVRGAEIRLRYTVDPEWRNVAREHAEAVKRELLSRGAADVKLDERVRPATRARAPEVARAKTLSDKMIAYWKARDSVPDDVRAKRLLGKVGQLESDREAS